jgi:hypothetical protein
MIVSLASSREVIILGIRSQVLKKVNDSIDGNLAPETSPYIALLHHRKMMLSTRFKADLVVSSIQRPASRRVFGV